MSWLYFFKKCFVAVDLFERKFYCNADILSIPRGNLLLQTNVIYPSDYKGNTI